MAIYMVGYDLNKLGQNYNAIIKALEAYSYWHCLDSTWLTISNESAKQIADKLGAFMDSNDELLVLEIPQRAAAAWVGFDEECSSWLERNL